MDAQQPESQDLALAEVVEEASRSLARKAPLEATEKRGLAFMPRTIEEAQRYASGLIAANQVPDAFRYSAKEATRAFQQGLQVREGDPNASLILMGILKSMELEVPPQTGLAGLLPLNGRFTVWGALATALVQQSGKVRDHSEINVGPGFDPDAPLGDWPADFGFECRYWRVGQESPYVGRFTVRDAKRAQLWLNPRRDPWLKYPLRMLKIRARGFVFNDGFADALHGLAIAEEVLDRLPPPDEDGLPPDNSALDDEPVVDPTAEAGEAGEAAQ